LLLLLLLLLRLSMLLLLICERSECIGMLDAQEEAFTRVCCNHPGQLTSKTQSVMLLLMSGTLTARPFSLPLSSGKMRAMAVALPVLVGARFTRPDLWG
jgi:hypothetical protein